MRLDMISPHQTYHLTTLAERLPYCLDTFVSIGSWELSSGLICITAYLLEDDRRTVRRISDDNYKSVRRVSI